MVFPTTLDVLRESLFSRLGGWSVHEECILEYTVGLAADCIDAR
jgi:hypothetical protein